MARRRFAQLTPRVAVLLLFSLASCLPLTDARRVGGAASGNEDNSEDPDILGLQTNIIYGHRGSAGTLGILAAAFFVIPAGVLSILYLIYVHTCRTRSGEGENEDGIVLDWGNPREEDMVGLGRLFTPNHQAAPAWSDSWEEKGLMPASDDNGIDGEVAAASTAMAEFGGWPPEARASEHANGYGPGTETSWPGVRAVTPVAELGDSHDSDPGIAGPEPRCPAFEGFVNTVEIAVSQEAADPPKPKRKPIRPAVYREAVTLQVVNQVHMEVQLTEDGDGGSSAARPGELYTSEVKTFLPGLMAWEESESRQNHVMNEGWL